MAEVIMRKVHTVKSWPDYYAPIKSGAKSFDVRRNDRDYQLGDIVVFQEFDDKTRTYTGDQITRRICYLLEGVGVGGIGPLCGIMPGFVVMGLMETAHEQ